MGVPDIRIYYWGKRDGWNWWEASYRLNGVDRSDKTGEYGDFFPITIPGPSGDTTLPSIVSDSVFSGTAPFATVPIAIVNVGDGTLEEFNLDVVSHYWATGRAESGGGFSPWWTKNAVNFRISGNTYKSSNNCVSMSDLDNNEQNEDNNLWYREGLRVPDPNKIDPLPDSEDASTSKWNSQKSDIYDAEHTGFGPIRSNYGDGVLSVADRINVLNVALRKSIIGDLTSDVDLKGYYPRINYRNTGGYTGDEGVLKTFIRRSAANWAANEANVWRMGHVWSSSRNNYRKRTPFGDLTIKVLHEDSRYYLTHTNSDIMQPGRILRGYLWVSLYDKNQLLTSASDLAQPIISAGSGLEGVVFGRFFYTLSVFGRYYQ